MSSTDTVSTQSSWSQILSQFYMWNISKLLFNVLLAYLKIYILYSLTYASVCHEHYLKSISLSLKKNLKNLQVFAFSYIYTKYKYILHLEIETQSQMVKIYK